MSHVVDMSLILAGPVGDVTNGDYVGCLAQFANGAHGTLEVCRLIQGRRCQMAFEIEGTEGALSWDFERMNELKVFCPDRHGVHDARPALPADRNIPSTRDSIRASPLVSGTKI